MLSICRKTLQISKKSILLIVTLLCSTALLGQHRMTQRILTRSASSTQNLQTIELKHNFSSRGQPDLASPRPPVAIIIPYRDREIQLKIFINYMSTFLKNQNTSATIYVIEQFEGRFNRAKLFNVGYAEALKDYPFKCFIFHDVDLIPEIVENLYACDPKPIHMSAAVDKFGYKVPYSSIFGGAVALTDEHMKKTNGFSNEYWGWGGEDDDMYSRIRAAGFERIRKSLLISKYTMLQKTGKHTSEKPLASRMTLLRGAVKRMKTDGISNLKYKVLKKENIKIQTRIQVEIRDEAVGPPAPVKPAPATPVPATPAPATPAPATPAPVPSTNATTKDTPTPTPALTPAPTPVPVPK